MVVHFQPETRCICTLGLRRMQPEEAAISWFFKPEMHREALFEGRKAQMKIAHAGHAELLVTNLEASKKFFTETMGLSITEEDASTVYLRAWQDWEHHTLILRRGGKSALVHLGWRVETPESLEQFARHFA